MKIGNVNIIEIIWDGPKQFTSEINSKGLYQIYGTHPVNGPDNLLYIGKAGNNVNDRLSSHTKWWVTSEANECYYFSGELTPESIINEIFTKDELLSIAESLLIYFCQPPYNSSQKSGLIYLDRLQNEPVIVMNYGKRNLLPYEVSSLYYSKFMALRDNLNKIV